MPKRRVHVVETSTDRVVHSEDTALENAKSDGDVDLKAKREDYKFLVTLP